MVHHHHHRAIVLPPQIEEGQGWVRLTFVGTGFCTSFPPALDGVVDRQEYLNRILPQLQQLEVELDDVIHPSTCSQLCPVIPIMFLWITLVGAPIALALLCLNQARLTNKAIATQNRIAEFMEQNAASLTKQYEASHGIKFFHVSSNNFHSMEIRFAPRNPALPVGYQPQQPQYASVAAVGVVGAMPGAIPMDTFAPQPSTYSQAPPTTMSYGAVDLGASAVSRNY